jgi:sulfur carrier protein ThiS
MKKLLGNKLVIGGAVLAVLLVAYYFYDKRGYKFANTGNSKWIVGANNKDKLSFMMENKPTGLSVGDPITVNVDGTDREEQMTIVELLDTNNQYNAYWVITSNNHKSYPGEGHTTGKLKKA